MKNKKGLIIGIIAVFVIAIILVVLYFVTDIFKTNKQLFYKYISKAQMMDNNLTKMYTETNKKINENSYSSIGQLEFLSLMENSETGSTDTQNIFTIKSNGLENALLKQSYKDFTLSTNNQNILTLRYIRDDNTYALGADNILAKYVGIENTNLKDLFNKLGVEDVSAIPDTISNNYEELFKIDKETLTTLGKTYLSVLNNYIPENNFYKASNEDGTETIGLTLTEQETANLISAILKTAKDDALFLNLVIDKAQLLGYTNITAQNIQDEIQKVLDENADTIYNTTPDFIKLSLIKKGKQLIGIELEINQLVERKQYVEGASAESIEELPTTTITENNKYNYKIDLSEPNKIVFATMENDIETNVLTYTYNYDENNINMDLEIENVKNEQTEETEKIHIQFQLTGYQTEHIVKKCVVDLPSDDELNYQITLSNEITLSQDVQIEKLTTENSIKLNNMTAEEIKQFFTALTNRVITLYGENINSLSLGFNM